MAEVEAVEGEQGVASASVRRRRIGVAALLAGGVLGAGLLAGWIEREPIVTHFADRTLAKAHVPASYRIVSIGPFHQRLQDVRLGDPAHPDLIAQSVDLEMGYGLTGAHLVAVRAEGVRLSARLANGQLSLGSLDGLIPKSSGAPSSLPDMDLSLSDTQVSLETPAGTLGIMVQGHGHLTDGFHGEVTASADRLSAGGCMIASPHLDIAIRIRGGQPHIAGPLNAAAISCPAQGVALGAGRAILSLGIEPTLDHWQGFADISGFGGGEGSARFGDLSGRVTLAGDAQRMDGTAHVVAHALAAPDVAAERAEIVGPYRYAPGGSGFDFTGNVRLKGVALSAARRSSLATATKMTATTPVGPLMAKAGAGIDRLLAHADADAAVAFSAGGAAGTALRLRRLDMSGTGGGGFVRLEEGAGIGWQARDKAWRVDGRLTTGGGDLPQLSVAVHQPEAGGAISGTATLAPYAADGARMMLTPVRFERAKGVTRFSTVATLDGPLASGGHIEGLTVPLAGQIDPRGGMRLGAGCTTIGFRAMTVAGMTLDPSRIPLCGVNGAPLLVTGAGGTRFGAAVSGLHLGGHSGAAPLTLTAARAQVTDAGLAIANLSVRLGATEPQTSLDVASITGGFGNGGLSGRFENGAERIGPVPVLLSGTSGDWTLAKSVLTLKGGLTVTDTAEAPRYLPMSSSDVAFALDGGVITATGSLAEPKSGASVARVSIRHDLANGKGQAILDVPGLTFAPKGLQPEALTPLTLGVIANVAGTVSGKGVIDWSPKGVTSSGDFGTEGIDLAAAFGPVRQIVGTIHFSDLLGLVTPPHQEARITEINPGIAVSNGVVHYQLVGQQQVAVEDAAWPFAGGDLVLEPSLLAFDEHAQRHLTFRVHGLDAAAFVQQLAFPNISATGVFDGVLPMIFDQTGGRITGGELVARKGGGSLAYVGELTNAQLGAMGKLAFDALKKIRYNALTINLDGRLDGEIVSHVSFDGVRQDTGESTMVARVIRNLPFRFNIQIHAPFRGLMGTARAFVDPSVLLGAGQVVGTQPDPAAPVRPAAGPSSSTPSTTQKPAAKTSAIQPSDSEIVR